MYKHIHVLTFLKPHTQSCLTHVLIISIDAIKDLDDGVSLTVLVISISVRYLEVTVIIVGRKIMSNNGPSTDLCLTLCR